MQEIVVLQSDTPRTSETEVAMQSLPAEILNAISQLDTTGTSNGNEKVVYVMSDNQDMLTIRIQKP